MNINNKNINPKKTKAMHIFQTEAIKHFYQIIAVRSVTITT